MAFTFVVTKRGVFGDMRYAMGTWDADSVTSGPIVTGLGNIKFSDVVNKVNENDNALIDDTTTAGTIAMTGVTSDDTGTWIAYGDGN